MKEDRLAKLKAMKEKNQKLRDQLTSAPNTYSSNSGTVGYSSATKISITTLEEKLPNSTKSENKTSVLGFGGPSRRYKKEKYKNLLNSLSTYSLDEIMLKGNKKDRKNKEVQCDDEICQYLNSDNENKTSGSKLNSKYSKDKEKVEAKLPIFHNVSEVADKKEKAEDYTPFNKLINNENKKPTIITDDLIGFLDNQPNLIENCLHEKQIYDFFKCYYDDEGENEINTMKTQKFISNFIDYYDENLCLKRSVTNLEFSEKQPESLMSVYSKSDDSNLNDPHGLILLWNLNKKKQEYSIVCQTEITSAIFHKHNPNLIIGGTYTGQIIVWDTRGKPVPVQKTPSGGKYHSHPIYCLGMTGSLNSNNIISISNDGVLCTWSQANLSKNSKHIFLRAKKKKSNETTFDNGSNQYMEEIGAICMATSETEPNNILIGTDESELYQVCTNQSNSENLDHISDVFRKHTAPITGLDLHPGDNEKNATLDHLFLSSSMDWTINLWSKRIDSPIMTFEMIDDYVNDLKWHPTNPSVFVSGDCSGKLDLWDLNKDSEAPIFRHEVGKDALNKIAWSSDGKKLSLGDINGKIHIFNVEKELIDHKDEDSFKMEKIINKKNFVDKKTIGNY